MAFQQQSPQRLVDEYEHMNSRNDRLDLRLNPLQRENYYRSLCFGLQIIKNGQNAS